MKPPKKIVCFMDQNRWKTCVMLGELVLSTSSSKMVGKLGSRFDSIC